MNFPSIMLPVRLLFYLSSFVLWSSSTSTRSPTLTSIVPGDPLVQFNTTDGIDWIDIYPHCSHCLSEGNYKSIVSSIRTKEYVTSSFVDENSLVAVYGPPYFSSVTDNPTVIPYYYEAGDYFNYSLPVWVPGWSSTSHVYSIWYFPDTSNTLTTFHDSHPFGTIVQNSSTGTQITIPSPTAIRLCRYHNNTSIQVLLGNIWGISTLYFALRMRYHNVTDACAPLLISSSLRNMNPKYSSDNLVLFYTAAVHEPVRWDLEISSDRDGVLSIVWLMNNTLLHETNLTSLSFRVRTDFSFTFESVQSNQVWNITVFIMDHVAQQHTSKEWLIIPRTIPFFERNTIYEKDIYLSESVPILHWTDRILIEQPTLPYKDEWYYRWTFLNGIDYVTVVPELQITYHDPLRRNGPVYLTVSNDVGNYTMLLYNLVWVQSPVWVQIPSNRTHARYGQPLELKAIAQGYSIQCVWKRYASSSLSSSITLTSTMNNVVIVDTENGMFRTSTLYLMYPLDAFVEDADTLQIQCWNAEGSIESSYIDITLLPYEWSYGCDNVFNLPSSVGSIDMIGSITEPFHRNNSLFADYFPFRLYYRSSLYLTLPIPSSSSTVSSFSPCLDCSFLLELKIFANNASLCGWNTEKMELVVLPFPELYVLSKDKYQSIQLNQSVEPYTFVFSLFSLPPEYTVTVPSTPCSVAWEIMVRSTLPSSRIRVPNKVCNYSITVPIAPSLESINPSLVYNSTWIKPTINSEIVSVPLSMESLQRFGETFQSSTEYNILIPAVLTGCILGLAIASLSIANYTYFLDSKRYSTNTSLPWLVPVREWLRNYCLNIRWNDIWEWIQFCIILDQSNILYHVSLTKYLSMFYGWSGLLPTRWIDYFFDVRVATDPSTKTDNNGGFMNGMINSFTRTLLQKLSRTENLSTEELNLLSVFTVPYRSIDRFLRHYSNPPQLSLFPFYSTVSLLLNTFLLVTVLSFLLLISLLFILHRIRKASYSLKVTSSSQKIRLTIYPRNIGNVYGTLVQWGLYLWQPIAMLTIIYAFGTSVVNEVQYSILFSGLALLFIYSLYCLRLYVCRSLLWTILRFLCIAVVLNAAYFTEDSFLCITGLLIIYTVCELCMIGKRWLLFHRPVRSLSFNRQKIYYENEFLRYLCFCCILFGHTASIVKLKDSDIATDSSTQAKIIESMEGNCVFTIITVTMIIVSLLFTKLFIPFPSGSNLYNGNVVPNPIVPYRSIASNTSLSTTSTGSSASFDSAHPSTPLFASSYNPLHRKNVNGKVPVWSDNKTRVALSNTLTDDMDKVFQVLNLPSIPTDLPNTLVHLLYQWYSCPLSMLIYTLTKVYRIVSIRVPTTVVPVASPLMNYPRSHVRTFLPPTVSNVAPYPEPSLLSRISRTIERTLSRLSRNEITISSRHSRNENIGPSTTAAINSNLASNSEGELSFTTTNPYYRKTVPNTASDRPTLSNVAARVAKLSSTTSVWRTPWEISAAGKQDFMVINYPSRAPVVKRKDIDASQLANSIDYGNGMNHSSTTNLNSGRRNSVVGTIGRDLRMNNGIAVPQRRSRSASPTLDRFRTHEEQEEEIMDGYDDMPPLEDEFTGELYYE